MRKTKFLIFLLQALLLGTGLATAPLAQAEPALAVLPEAGRDIYLNAFQHAQ